MNPCPPIERLAALVRGELDEAEAGTIEDHLEGCRACRDRIHELSSWALTVAGADWPSAEALGPRSRGVLDRLAGHVPSAADGGSGPDGTPSAASRPSGRSELPADLPGFRVLREVGRGGMGTVYRAEQLGLSRPVALKVLSEGWRGKRDALERFNREVRALARLVHPNVVAIHDVGEHDGHPFLVMEWVEGGDLAGRLRDGPLPVRLAAELCLPLARAVQAANDRGIIHRDLKPGNVLLAVGEGGGAGRPTPKIGDFGLAKLIEEEDRSLTLSGVLVGTPGYMAPEQTGLVRANAQGPATDIYGLGAILYEMLVGRPPFVGGSRAETIHQIVAGDLVPPRRLRPGIPRDLETICLKCLSHDPGHRYPTAGDLAGELERFLEGRPVRARRSPVWEQAVRWGRRKPAEARLVLALVAVVALAFASVTSLWRLADAEARRAVDAAASESRLRAKAQAEVAERDLDRGIALARSGEVDQGLLWMAESLRKVPDDRPELARLARANLAGWGDDLIPLRAILEHQGIVSHALYCDGGRAILTGSRDGTAQLWDAATGRPLRPPIRHGDQVLYVAISPDGRLIATTSTDRRVRIWDAETSRPVGPSLHHGDAVTWADFSPDGRLLASHSNDRVVHIWDVATGRHVGPPTEAGPLRELRFTPDGRTIAARTADGTLRSWDSSRMAGPGTDQATPRITGFLVGPDPSRIGIACEDGSARVWDLAARAAVGPPIPEARPLAFSPDGRTLLVLEPRGRVRIWNPAVGRGLGPDFHHPAEVESATLSPDGRLLLTAGLDHTARLWDAATGRRIGPPLRHRLVVHQAEFAPDGRSILTRSEDGTARLWSLDSILPAPLGPDPEAPPQAVPSQGRSTPGIVFETALADRARARMLLRSQDRGLARMVAVADGQPIGPPLLSCWPCVGAEAISPAGDRFAIASFDHTRSQPGTTASTCQIFDLATGRPSSPLLPHANWPARMTFSPDGRILATGDYSGLVHCWDVATGARLRPPFRAGSPVMSLAFSPDGRLLAAGTAERERHLQLWDLAAGRLRGEPIRFKDWVHRLAFSPDGTRLAAGSHDSTTRLIDTATGLPIGEPLRHAGRIDAVGFSLDSSILLTATQPGPERDVVRSWAARDGRPRPGSVNLPAFIAQDLAFSPDGTLFAAGCDDGSVSLWDLATMRQVGPPRVLRGRVTGLAFSPDGASLLAADAGGHLTTWIVPKPFPEPPAVTARRLGARTGVELDPAGQVAVLDVDEWRSLRAAGGGDADDPSSDASRGAEWHEACARDAEADGDGDGDAARWHLDRLIAARPDDGLLRARRAVAALWVGVGNGESAPAEAARADLDRALELGPRDRVVDWLAHRAEDLRAAGDPAGALLLIDRAVAARPDDWILHVVRSEALDALSRPAARDAAAARAVELGADIPTLLRFAEGLAQGGRYRESARLLDRAVELGEVPYELWEWSALVHLAMGDQEGYRRMCDKLRSRFTDALPSVQAAYILVHACTLGPGGLGDDGKVAAWAAGTPPLEGAVAYREGRHAEAVAALRRAIAQADGQVQPEEAALLAMALHLAGDRAAARAMLARCPRPRDPAAGMLGRDQQSADQIRREADALLFADPLPRDVFAR